MDNLSIEKFDPMIADLKLMVLTTQGIVSVNHNDPEDIKRVSAKRKELRDRRKEIEEFGKGLRAGALAFQKEVIAKEDSIVAIIEPEERRLKALEDEAKEKVEMEARVALLPMRKERLATIKDGIEVSDEYLLKLDPEEFTAYYNQRVGDKNAKDSAEIAKKQAEVDRKQAEADRKVREAEIAEKARLEGIEAGKKAEKEKAEEQAREAQRIEDEKQAEADKLAKQARYQAWLLDNEYQDNGEFKLFNTDKEIVLFKKISTFTK